MALLVDSEDTVPDGVGVWNYLPRGKPSAANDDSAHLMVRCMESWFFADRDNLIDFFGRDIRARDIPKSDNVENIAKDDVYRKLERATRECQKGKYDKGKHSYNTLARLDPAKVAAASPHAMRLLQTLRDRANGG